MRAATMAGQRTQLRRFPGTGAPNSPSAAAQAAALSGRSLIKGHGMSCNRAGQAGARLHAKINCGASRAPTPTMASRPHLVMLVSSVRDDKGSFILIHGAERCAARAVHISRPNGSTGTFSAEEKLNEEAGRKYLRSNLAHLAKKQENAAARGGIGKSLLCANIKVKT